MLTGISRPRGGSAGRAKALRMVSCEMSEEKAMEQLEHDMHPGKCSNGGFLGWNESLLKVITQDETTLKKVD